MRKHNSWYCMCLLTMQYKDKHYENFKFEIIPTRHNFKQYDRGCDFTRRYGKLCVLLDLFTNISLKKAPKASFACYCKFLRLIKTCFVLIHSFLLYN